MDLIVNLIINYDRFVADQLRPVFSNDSSCFLKLAIGNVVKAQANLRAEAALARELALPYASVCMVVNAAAGLSEIPLTIGAMVQILERESLVINELLATYLRDL